MSDRFVKSVLEHLKALDDSGNFPESLDIRVTFLKNTLNLHIDPLPEDYTVECSLAIAPLKYNNEILPLINRIVHEVLDYCPEMTFGKPTYCHMSTPPTGCFSDVLELEVLGGHTRIDKLREKLTVRLQSLLSRVSSQDPIDQIGIDLLEELHYTTEWNEATAIRMKLAVERIEAYMSEYGQHTLLNRIELLRGHQDTPVSVKRQLTRRKNIILSIRDWNKEHFEEQNKEVQKLNAQLFAANEEQGEDN